MLEDTPGRTVPGGPLSIHIRHQKRIGPAKDLADGRTSTARVYDDLSGSSTAAHAVQLRPQVFPRGVQVPTDHVPSASLVLKPQ